MRKRLLTAVPAAGLALVFAAGPAMAHECYIPTRSWQGDLKAGTNSQAWFRVDLNAIFAEDVAAGNLTAAQATCLLTELGLFSVKRGSAVGTRALS